MNAVPRKKLGRFEIVRVLGKGAMGIVYEGLDPRLNRRVAIKTILRSAILDDAEAKEYAQRFVREAQAVARLTHPNIVGVYDFGDEGDITFIVMEFIDGKELKSFLDADHRFDFPTAVRIMTELLDGLGYAHKQGVVHRDIKPANIMIDTEGRVKLTDFGVARITESAERTQVGTMVGTPSYMSPEQIQGLSIDNRTDLFACGVILYQLLTGEKPFNGVGTWTIYNQILQENPRPATELNTKLPPAIDRVVSRALAKVKEDRFRNAQDFVSALTGLLMGDGDGAGEPDADATRILLASDARRMQEAAATRHADATDPSRLRALATERKEGTRPQGGRTEPTTPPGGRTEPTTPPGGRTEPTAPPAVRTEATTPPGQSSIPPGHELDLEFWRSMKDSNDAADYDLYMQRFPDGTYVELARRKAARLRAPAALEETEISNASAQRTSAAPAQAAGTVSAAARATGDATLQAELAALGARQRAAETTAQTVPIEASVPSAATPPPPPGPASTGAPLGLIGGGAAGLVALGLGAWLMLSSGEKPPPVAPAPATAPAAPRAPDPGTSVRDVAPSPDQMPATREVVRPKEDDQALRKLDSALERANESTAAKAGAAKAAAERSAAEKAAAEKAAAEKAAAAKAAAERAAAEKSNAERAAAERAAAEQRAAAERAASEQRAAAERAAAEQRAATERAAAEKAAAEKAAADKAAAEKAAIAKAAAERAAIEKAAAEKAAAEKAAAERLAAERAQAAQRSEAAAAAKENESAKRAGGRQN
jgi:eukaryotic-like serine/threonine-protein kinase